jgi:hypothetical protein
MIFQEQGQVQARPAEGAAEAGSIGDERETNEMQLWEVSQKLFPVELWCPLRKEMSSKICILEFRRKAGRELSFVFELNTSSHAIDEVDIFNSPK